MLVRFLVAIAAPVAVSAAWIACLFAIAETHPASNRAKDVDEVLDAQPLDVLLLGNSAANRGIDAEQLGASLGRNVTSITLAATLAPAWYVILRDRVYARGLEPEIVIIADTPPGMLAVEQFSETLHEKMLELASGDDPVRARADAHKGAFGRGLSTVSVATHRVRDGVVDALRNTTVGILFGRKGLASIQARGKVEADAAVDLVFNDGGIRAEGPDGVLALDVRKDQDELSVIRSDPMTSFVPDTIDLVESHGGRLVYVHLPRRTGVLDPVTFETRAALVAYLNERGVSYLDLSLFPDPEMFADNNHLLPEGQVVLTDLLATAMYQRVLAEEGFEAAQVSSARAAVSRTGTPTALPIGRVVRIDSCTYEVATPVELGAPALAALHVYMPPLLVQEDGKALRRTATEEPGCTGTFVSAADRIVIHPTGSRGDETRFEVVLDPSVPQAVAVELGPLDQFGAATPTVSGAEAYWVFPGTALRIEEPMSPPVPGRVELRTSALVVWPGTTDPRLGVAGTKVTTEADGRVIRSTKVKVPGDEPVVVVWRSPEDGPILLVRDLQVVPPREAPRYVLGSAVTSSVVAGFLPSDWSHAVARWETDPPVLTPGPVEVAADKSVGIFEIRDGPWLTMSLASKIAGRKHCSPLVVDLDGTFLDARPGPSGVHFDLAADQIGRAQEARPLLHPERRCTWWPAERKAGSTKGAAPMFLEPLKTARWIYPGDRARFARPDIAEMHGTAQRLAIEGFRYGEPGKLDVRVAASGSPEPHSGEAEQGPFRWVFPLATPLDPRDAENVAVRLVSPPEDKGFFYLTAIDLLEAEPDE